ncbi:MAG: Lipid-A-disaccharide synthase [Holosporales bacterium]
MTKTIYLIAGEPSGDFLGARLMRALKAQEPTLQFKGVGGRLMQAEGLETLFPMEEIAVMGFFEILPKILKIRDLIKKTVIDIELNQPDTLVCIDSPGFCKRILKKVKHLSCQKFYYVAPSVWAWRAGRAKKLAQLVDHLFCLFPFEPPYFIENGLKTTFVGHPLVEDMPTSFEKNPNAILLLPGSRWQEINTLLPVFLDVATRIYEKVMPHATFSILTLPQFKDTIQKIVNIYKLPIDIKIQDHAMAFQGAAYAVAASGTVSLELSKYKVPHVIAYKVHPMTAFLVRLFIHVRFVALPNLLKGRVIVPECLQECCTTDSIYHAFLTLTPENGSDLYDAFLMLKNKSGLAPSALCAEIILKS